MKSQNLGCLSINALISMVLTLVIIAVFMVATGNAMFSPGLLNDQANGLITGGVATHAETGSDCGACHAAFWSPEKMTDRCQDCHDNLMEMGNDFHIVMAAQGQDVSCQRCHTEHNGADASLTRMELINFPHDEVGFSLKMHTQTSNGLSIACMDCHPQIFSRPDTDTCIDCHAQYQPQTIQAHIKAFPGDCIGCHDGVDRFHAFDHSQTDFALVGEHQLTACQNCHHNGETLADLQNLPNTCRDCHGQEDPHAGQFTAQCADCHTAESWSPSIFDHQTADFILTGAHMQTDCTDCHNSFGESGERVYGDTSDECLACHAADEPHEQRFGPDCQDCHTTTAWYPAEFDHDLAAFKLEGWHVMANCESCHNQLEPNGRPKYVGTPTDCFSCHQADDAHAGELGADCRSCHTPLGWAPSTYDHALAVFQLTGAHVQTACQNCHIKDAATGRQIFSGTPVNCAGCHTEDDAHAGQFGPECQTCHTTSAWKPSTFDHTRASFQLTGAHVNTACQNCHIRDAATGQLTFSGTPVFCAGCHIDDDAHNGQFGPECQTCHTTSAWKPSTFDHARTSFQLTGAHANTACKSCHTQGWSGTPTACAACHREPSLHAGVFGTACQNCHSTSAWRPANYNGPHSFPMGHGRANSCRDCHPSSYANWTCYTCHNKGEITKKHNEEGIGNFSNCLRCHPTGREDGGGDDD